MTATSWARKQIDKGVKLELTPHWDRNCWKKKRKGKQTYLQFPLTAEGYRSALLEWHQILARVDGERPNATVWQHHKYLFSQVQDWFGKFGIPSGEKTTSKQVDDFLNFIEETWSEPELPAAIPAGVLPKSFVNEFVKTDTGYTTFGMTIYELPEKWQERVRQFEASPKKAKCPQTVIYWFDEYEQHIQQRSNLSDSTKFNHPYKMKPFRDWLASNDVLDGSHHICELNEDTLIGYQGYLAERYPKETAQPHYSMWKSWLKYMVRTPRCDFDSLPSNFDDPTLRFVSTVGKATKRMQKKSEMWTREHFEIVLNEVPQPFRCYIALMLNCGFRHSDLSELKHENLKTVGRLIYQRKKTINVDTAPLVNYPLWDITQELLSEVVSDDEVFVFVDPKGGRLVKSKKNKKGQTVQWCPFGRKWKRERARWGLDKMRLGLIRHTGSTSIEMIDRGIETLYLADSVKGIGRFYNHNDGEVFSELDVAIMQMGFDFGMCEKPLTRTLKIGNDLMESLSKKAEESGVSIEVLLRQL